MTDVSTLNSALMFKAQPPGLKPMAGADFLSGSRFEPQSDFESLRSLAAADRSASAQSVLSILSQGMPTQLRDGTVLGPGNVGSGKTIVALRAFLFGFVASSP